MSRLNSPTRVMAMIFYSILMIIERYVKSWKKSTKSWVQDFQAPTY